VVNTGFAAHPWRSCSHWVVQCIDDWCRCFAMAAPASFAQMPWLMLRADQSGRRASGRRMAAMPGRQWAAEREDGGRSSTLALAFKCKLPPVFAFLLLQGVRTQVGAAHEYTDYPPHRGAVLRPSHSTAESRSGAGEHRRCCRTLLLRCLSAKACVALCPADARQTMAAVGQAAWGDADNSST
jgi:hypothetical protein